MTAFESETWIDANEIQTDKQNECNKDEQLKAFKLNNCALRDKNLSNGMVAAYKKS